MQAAVLLLLLEQVIVSDKMSRSLLRPPPPCPCAGSSSFIKLLSWALAHISSRLPPETRESAAAVLCAHGQEPCATCPGCMWLVPMECPLKPVALTSAALLLHCTVTAGTPVSWSGSGSSTSATATRLLAKYDAAVEIWKQGEEELRPLEDCWLRCLLFLLAPGGSPASQAGGQPGTSASSAAASSEPSGHS